MLTEAVRARDLDKYHGRKILLQFDQDTFTITLHYTSKSWDLDTVYLYEVGRVDPILRLKGDFIVSVLPEEIKSEEEPKKEVKVTNEVFGRPIEGEIRPTSTSTPKQDNPIKLVNLLDALLALPGVVEYKWVQYTPYWMDGEECEFGVSTDYNAGVKLEFGDPEGGEAGDGYYESFSTSYYPELKDHDTSEIETAVDAVANALHSGRHDVWIKETFGDHASVIANLDGFKVEFYQHD